MHRRLSHIDTWIFNPDLILYCPETNIVAQVRERSAFLREYSYTGSDVAFAMVEEPVQSFFAHSFARCFG